MTTIAALRSTFAEYFGTQHARTVLLRLREAGLLPDGAPGRAGSAEITPRHAAVALIALAVDAEPIDAPAEAQRIAAFKLLRHDETPGGCEPTIKTPFENQHIDLLTTIALEIERFDEDRIPSSWAIASHGVCQINPDRLVFGPS